MRTLSGHISRILIRARCGAPARYLSLPLALAAASLAQAGPIFGTKADSIASPQGTAGGVGLIPFAQMMAALVIVFLLIKFGLPKIAQSLQRKASNDTASGIRIEETTPIPGGSLHLVSVRNRIFLIGATQSSVQCLADLTEANAQPEQPLFMDILDRETQNPSLVVAQAHSTSSELNGHAMSDEEIRAAIDRLGELGI